MTEEYKLSQSLYPPMNIIKFGICRNFIYYDLI